MSLDLFKGGIKLKSINFNSNKLKKLDQELFNGCKVSLEEIDFSFNEIHNLDKDLFNGCNKLKSITLSDNHFKDLNKKLFNGCKESIEEIDFSNNEIDHLPKSFFEGCNKLKSLKFNNNKIKELNEEFFTNCNVSLESIDFSSNEISQLHHDLFKGCNKLESIRLSNNKLKELDEKFFNEYKEALKEIDFSNNKLKSLPYFNLPSKNYRVNILDNIYSFDTFNILFLKVHNKKELKSFSYFFKEFEHFQKFKSDSNKALKQENQNKESFDSNCLEGVFDKCVDNFEIFQADLQKIFFKSYLDDIEKDNDKVFLCRRKNLKSLFLLFLNSKIYNNEDKEAFVKFEEDFKRLKNYDITILDFLINLGNDFFSNENLINLNQNFELEKRQLNKKFINLEFQLRSPESIEALCERNDYFVFKKVFDLDKLEEKCEKPKDLIEKINFLKCFDIALKNNNEKIAKYLLKILSYYTFNLEKNLNKIDEKFNQEFLDKNALEKLKIIEIIKKLENYAKMNEKNINIEKDRDWWEIKKVFNDGYELFLDMEGTRFKKTINNLVKEYNSYENKFKTFNQIFLRIFLQVFFQFEWFEAIDYFFDQCKKYKEAESNEKNAKNDEEKRKEKVKKEKEFLPFFCFNKIGYIKGKKNDSGDSSKADNIAEPFSTFFIFKLVKNIVDKSTRKKFLNHKAFLNLVNMEWRSFSGLIYYLRLLMYLIFLVFYSINIEIYSKSDSSSSPLNLACKIICFILLFLFWCIEIGQIIVYAIKKDAFGYIFDFKNLAEFFNFPLCIFSLLYDIFGSNIEVKSSFYVVTILISYFIFIKRLDKIGKWNIGAKINVIGKIIRKSFPITLLLLIAALAFILSFRNRSTYYEMSGIGGDDLTQMSYFNTTFEYNIFQILQFGLGGISVSQMGIEMIQGSNWVNYFIYGCFIFIMPIMFFNILTAVSLDAIGDMMKNASDNIILNKIHYFEIKEFYFDIDWIGKNVIKINEIFYSVENYISEIKLVNFKVKRLKDLKTNYLQTEDNSLLQEVKAPTDFVEANFLSMAKFNEKNKESLIIMVKSLINKFEIKNREAKQNANELAEKINEINVKNKSIDQLNIKHVSSQTPLFSHTFDIKDQENKKRLKELEDKFNKVEKMLLSKTEDTKDKEANSNSELLNIKINGMDEKMNKADKKMNKINDKIEQIIMTLNQLNNNRGPPETHKTESFTQTIESKIADYKDENKAYFDNIKNAHARTYSAYQIKKRTKNKIHKNVVLFMPKV